MHFWYPEFSATVRAPLRIQLKTFKPGMGVYIIIFFVSLFWVRIHPHDDFIHIWDIQKVFFTVKSLFFSALVRLVLLETIYQVQSHINFTCWIGNKIYEQKFREKFGAWCKRLMIHSENIFVQSMHASFYLILFVE